MAYVGGIFNPPALEERAQAVPNGRRAALQARYLSGLYTLEEMGPRMRQTAARVGMEQAEVWIALTDGGKGLEAFMQKNFNRADLVPILDFYHAASYLEKLAKALHPQDETASQSQAERWCSLLKAEGGALTLEVLRQWDWPARKSAALREQLETVLTYFGNNVHRMAYPEYLAEGWHIGGGVVESACKTVVGQRLKGPGMRWGEEGRMRCVTSAPCTAARKANGKPSGIDSSPNHLFSKRLDAYTWLPDNRRMRGFRRRDAGRSRPAVDGGTGPPRSKFEKRILPSPVISRSGRRS